MARGGTTILTVDGVVGISGAPTRVYGMEIQSGGTAGRVILYNGTDATGGNYVNRVGKSNQGDPLDFGAEGKFFPAGCYADLDANVTRVIIQYENTRNAA